MSESDMSSIEINKPTGETHPLAQAPVLADVKANVGPKQELVPLVDYLKNIAGKQRGTKGGAEDLNSHGEEFIVKSSKGINVNSLSELHFMLNEQGLDIEILGVQSIGNPNQKVTAMVQGVDRNNPKSGFERPTVAEGPHMILAPFAIDNEGQLHLFRTIQMRTGEAVIDTPRGFADSKSLQSGEQMYDVENAGEKVTANMQRIVGEESGNALQIRRIVYLGAPRVNGTFVTSKSAIFGVEVDYEAFKTAQKVVSPEELQRRKEQFEHEGLVGDVLDITLPQYANYKRDSEISKDMAADFGTDTVVIDFLERSLTDLSQKERRQSQILSAEGKANAAFKHEDPAGYVEHRLRASKARHPENFAENEERAKKYLSKLYRSGLKKSA